MIEIYKQYAGPGKGIEITGHRSRSSRSGRGLPAEGVCSNKYQEVR